MSVSVSVTILDILTAQQELTTLTSWPIHSAVLAFAPNDSIADADNVTTTITFNNAYLASANLTPSNITAHSTNAPAFSNSNDIITITTTTTTIPTTLLYSTISTTITAIGNGTQQQQRQQTTRNNAFEVPIWLILCYSVILLFAIVGNLLVISTLVQNRRMRTITNVFLLNLAISDILLGVLCMPVTLVGTLLRHFIFGEFFCKLIQFSQAASVAVSSWTLVAISCERYYAICHPLRSRRWQTRSHAYKIIACIWCGSMLCMLPIAMFSQLMPTSRQGYRKCRENWPSYALPYERTYNLFLDLILLVLPLMILSVAYILITRTLYVGMRIEKAMIFGGKQEDMQQHSAFQRKSNNYGSGTSLLGKSSYLSTSSLSSTTASSSSRLKLNLSFRCHGPTTSVYNNTSTTCTTNLQGNFESHTKEKDLFYQQQQQQQQQHNLQLPAQRLYQQQHHNFQNYHHHQHQIVLHHGEEGQQRACEQQHQQHYHHQQQQEHHCCETLSRLCCKRLTSSSSANLYNGRPHLYCMRFATLKTTLPDKDASNGSSSYCTSDCCSSGGGGATTTATTSMTTLTSSSASTSSTAAAGLAVATSTSNSTMYRYQMQQQQQQQQLHNHHQHQTFNNHHGRCYCLQQVVPQFNSKADAKKSFSNKRSLKATESVLRRNNIAKNLESKKRVVKMLSVLVLEFFICWTPLYVINTVAMYIGSAIYEYIDYTSISALQLLAYSSSCCNPITYCFMNANFRRAFWDTFKGIQWCGKRFQRKRSTPANGTNLCLAGSMRVNSCTVQTVIDSPRL